MLQAACDLDPTVDNCVLPVNANIKLSNLGVGQMTEVHVSIDIFANNATSSAPAIWHHPKDKISTIVRVILPAGYYVCQEDSHIFSTLQGDSSGVKGVTGAGGFRQVIAEAKGRIVTQPSPESFKRTSTEIDLADPCQPLCKERVFEMETFHMAGCEALADGGDNDACRPTSSSTPGNESRITFTIANVRNPETRSRNAMTGVDGELQSAAATRSVQFGVQIFKKIIEIRNSKEIPRLTMRYYNNRINDRQLNTSILSWFDRTSNSPVILRENQLWNASVSFQAEIKNELTTAMFRMHVAAPVPPDGFIRIMFPDSFLVSEESITSVEVWIKSVNRQWLRPYPQPIDGFYVYANSEFKPLSSRASRSIADALYQVYQGDLYELFQESGSRALQNPVEVERTQHFIHNSAGKTNLTFLVTKAPIGRNHELLIVIDQVKTPERSQTLDFMVLTGSDNTTSVLHDTAVIASLPLGPNILRNPLVHLSTYEAGAESVIANFSFTIVNRLSRGSTVLVRLPLADFRFEDGNQPILLGQNPFLIESTHVSNDGGFLELTLKFLTGDGSSACGQGGATAGDPFFCVDADVRFDIGGFKNRRFAGPSTADIYIETRGSATDPSEVLDTVSLQFSSDMEPSNLHVQSLLFPARASGEGDIAVTFVVNNPVEADSEITLRFSALFQISQDTQVRGMGDNISWTQTRSNDQSGNVALALPSYDFVNQAGFNEITIYRRFARGHRKLLPGSNVTIIISNVRSPTYAVTPRLHITTFYYGSGGSDSAVFAIDSSVFAANVLLPALTDTSIFLGASYAGDMTTISIKMTIVNELAATGRMTVEFPADFDLTDARVAPTELPTTLERADCDDNLNCHDDTVFGFNSSGDGFWHGNFTLKAHESFLYAYDSLGDGIDGDFSETIVDPADCSVPVSVPNNSNSSGSCRVRVLSLQRTERMLSAIRFPAAYRLTSCSRSAPSNCSQMCDPGKLITTNCTSLERAERWINVTEPASAVPADTLMTVHIKGVRNPPYSALTNESLLVHSVMKVRTLLPQGLAVDGNDHVASPDVAPAELQSPVLVLEDSRAFMNTYAIVNFSLSNPLHPGGRIRITFPISTSFLGLQHQTVYFKSTDDDGFDEDLEITSYLGNVLTITRAAEGVSINSVSMRLAVSNRPGAAGDSGEWKVETIVEAFNRDWRIVELYTFAPLPITTANFRSSSVTVLSLAGDVAASPEPIAGRALYVRVDLEVNQQIELQDKLFIGLSDGIFLPAPPAEVLVSFDCGNSNASVSSCSADETTDTCSWIETVAALSVDGQTLTLSRRQWSLLVPPRGTYSATGEKLSFTIHGAMARKTAGVMSQFTITHQGVTKDGPRPFEIDTLSPSPHDELTPCLLEEGDVQISQNVSAAQVTINASFVLCHDLAAGDLISFVFDRFYGCNHNEFCCDAHDQADAYSVAANSSIDVVLASVSGITFHSYSQGTGFSLQVPVDIGKGRRLSVLVGGLQNPMALPGTRHQITVETQEASSKGVYGRAMPKLLPGGGFVGPKTPARLLTFAPCFVSSASYLSGTMVTTDDIEVGMGNDRRPGYIGVQVPGDFSISGTDLALTSMTINGNTISSVPQKVGQDKIHLPLPDFVGRGSRITFKISGITTAAYAHLQRNSIAMFIVSGNNTVTESVDGFQLVASVLQDVAYGAVQPDTKTATELSFGMTLTREMSLTNSIEIHLDSLFTATNNLAAVQFKSSALAPTDPLAGLVISSMSGNSDFLVWVEPDGRRYSMGVVFTAASATQPGAGSNSLKITGNPAAGESIQLLHPDLQRCHHSLPVSSCLELCTIANNVTNVVGRDENCTNSSLVSINKYASQQSVMIPIGSRVGFSVSGFETPSNTGDYSISIQLVRAATDDTMQQGKSSVSPDLQPREVTTTTFANFTTGSSEQAARVGERANVSLGFVPDSSILAGSHLEIEFPLGATGFANLESVEKIHLDGNVVSGYTKMGKMFVVPLDAIGGNVIAGNQVDIRFDAAIRVPVLAGPSASITVTSVRTSDGSRMEMARVQGTVQPRHLEAASLSPLSTRTRFGASIDTKGANYLDISMKITSPLSSTASVVVGFPSSYHQTDVGCNDARGIWTCIKAASCVEGCTGSLTVETSSSLAALNLGNDVNGSAVIKSFHLTVRRDGDGLDIAPGTTITIRLFNFSVPKFDRITPEKCRDVEWTDTRGLRCPAYRKDPQMCGFEESVFKCCSCGGGNVDGFVVATEMNGHIMEWRGLEDFENTPSTFQSVSNATFSESCRDLIRHPEVTLDDWGAGNATNFKTIHMRITNAISAGDLIRIEFDKVDMVHDESVFTLAAFSVCNDRDDCTLVASGLRFNITTSAQFISLTASSPSDVPPDSLMLFSEVCKDQLTNRNTAGRLRQMRFTTIAASGEVMDDDQVDPAFCRNGSATWAAVAENDVSSKLTVSATSNVAGQRTDLELSIPSLPVDLPERSYILIYLPRSFVASTNYSLPAPAARSQSAPTTMVQDREEIPTIREDLIPSGPIAYPPMLEAEAPKDQRSVLRFSLQNLDAKDRLNIRLGAVTNPDFALGYPPAIGDSTRQQIRLVIQIITLSHAGEQGPMYWAQSQPLIVPGAFKDVLVEPASFTAASFVPRIELRFRTQNDIPANASFMFRLPDAVGLTSASKVTEESEGSIFTGTLASQVVADDSSEYLNFPSQCSNGNWVHPYPYCSSSPSWAQDNCGPASTCAVWQLTSMQRSACSVGEAGCSATGTPSRILAKRVVEYTSEIYMVPIIGYSASPCDVPNGRTTERPGSWIVPAGCDITRPYQNVSVQLLFEEPPGIVPKGTLLTIFLVNVRAPLRYGIEPLIDVQVMSDAFHPYQSNWLIDRNHRISLGVTRTGKIVDTSITMEGSNISSRVGQTSTVRVAFRIPGVMEAGSDIVLLMHGEVIVDAGAIASSAASVACTSDVASCPPLQYTVSVEPWTSPDYNATKVTFVSTNTAAYTNVTINITVSPTRNPLQGGQYRLVRKISIETRATSQETFSVSGLDMPSVAVDPRLWGSDATSTFDCTPNRLNSLVNVSVSLTAKHAVPPGGGISLRLPGELRRVLGQMPQLLFLKKTTNSIESRISGCSMLLEPQSEDHAIATVIVVSCSLTSSGFASPGDVLTLSVGPFFSPNKQPPYVLGAAAVRTVSKQAILSPFFDPWDGALAWGNEESRAIDQFEPVSANMTIMGPLHSLAAIVNTSEEAVAGEFRTLSISFVSSAAIPGGGSIKVTLPMNFALCRTDANAICTTGAQMEQCKIIPAQVMSVTGYNNQGQKTWEAPPTALKYNKACTDAATHYCARVCDSKSTTAFGDSAPSFIFDLATQGQGIPAGTKVDILIQNVRMPSRSGPVDAAQIELFSRSKGAGDRLDFGTFVPPMVIVPRELRGSNIFIAPHDTQASAVTEYTMLFHSATGVPAGGFIELEFPEGWDLDASDGPRVIDAAISGRISKHSSQSVQMELEPPLSPHSDAYKGKQIHIMQRTTRMCEVEKNFNDDSTHILPTDFNWPTTGQGMVSVCQTLGPGAETRTIQDYTVTEVLSAQVTSLNYKVTIDSTLRASTKRTFAISIGQQVVAREVTERRHSPTTKRVRMGPFPLAFPAQAVVNVTVGGIKNGPLTDGGGSYSGLGHVSTFTNDHRLIEEGEFRLCGSLYCDGNVLRKRFTQVQIVLDMKRAHAEGGFLLLLEVNNPIRKMSSVRIQFPGAFSGAHSVDSVSSVTSSDLSSRTDLASWVSPLLGQIARADVTLLPCTLSVVECSRSVFIQINSSIPEGSLLALHLGGKLRNPSRPGQCSGPCGTFSPTLSTFKYLVDLYGPPLAQDPNVKLIQMYNDKVQQNEIVAGLIEAAATSSVHEIIQHTTYISFSLFARSGLQAQDSIKITVPDPFVFEDGKFPPNTVASDPAYFYSGEKSVLNVVGSITGIRGLLGVSSIDGQKLTVRRCKVPLATTDGTLDVPINFTLGPFRNRDYGSVNYRGDVIHAGLFQFELLDQAGQLMESLPMQSPPIRPAMLEVRAHLDTNRSATLAQLDLRFKLFKSMLAADEIFVFLPKGYVVPKSQISAHMSTLDAEDNALAIPLDVTSHIQLEQVLDLQTDVPERVAVRLAVGRSLEKDRNITLSIFNIMTPVGGKRPGDLFTVSTASYGCSVEEEHKQKAWDTDSPTALLTNLVNIPAWVPRQNNWPADSRLANSADQCYWIMETNFGSTPSVDIDAGDISLSHVSIGMSSKVAGNQVMLSTKLTTRNPFPRDGVVMITLPRGYRAEAQVKACSAVLGQLDLSCSLPCSNSKYCPLVLRSDPLIQVIDDGKRVVIRNLNEPLSSTNSTYDLFPSREVLGKGPYIDQLQTPGFSGVEIAINISSIRLREASSQDESGNLTSTPGSFMVEIQDDGGRPVDRTYIGVPSEPLSPNILTMVSVLPLTFAELQEHTLAIRFKTFNSLVANGTMRLLLPTGYEYDKSTLHVVQAVGETDLARALNLQDDGPLQGLEYLPDYDAPSQELWFRLPHRQMPTEPQLLTMFISPLRTTQEVTGTFELATLTPEGEIIDQDTAVLAHERVPGLLMSPSISPAIRTAGAASEITVDFTSSTTLSNGSEAVILFPPTYTVLLPTQSDVSVHSVHVDGVCKCANTTSAACPHKCEPAAHRAAPAPIPDVRALSPVAGYSDLKQRVTVYGNDFEGSHVRARLGGIELPIVWVRTNSIPHVLVVEVDCSEQKRTNNSFCSLDLHQQGEVQTQKCMNPFGVGETFNTTKCGNGSKVGSTPVSMAWSGAIELSVTKFGYPSHGHFTSSKTNYTLYRRLPSSLGSCPNECSDRGVCSQIAMAGNEIGYLCKCRYPFEGIDCRTGPSVIALKPDFGDVAGGAEIDVEIFSAVPLTEKGMTYRCIFGTLIVTARMVPGPTTILRCLIPPKSRVTESMDTVPISITINQGPTCERDGCCYTTGPNGETNECFKGSISYSYRDFVYYVSSETETGVFVTTDELGVDTHAHVFSHSSHDFSDRPHAHLVRIESMGQTYVARSLTVDRSCDCGRGDYDCQCISTQGTHTHIFVHQDSAHSVGGHSHMVRVRTPALALPVPLPALNERRELDAQIAALYAKGALDSISEVAVDEILELKQIEERLVLPTGAEVQVPLPVRIPGGSHVRVVLAEGAIQVRTSAGPSDVHGIMTFDPVTETPCKNIARMCGGIVDRNMDVTSISILPSKLMYLGPVTAERPTAGTRVDLTFVLGTKNAIPGKDGQYGVIHIHLPQVFSMNEDTYLKADACSELADAHCLSGLYNPSNISLLPSSQSLCFDAGSSPCTLEAELCTMHPYADVCAAASNFVQVLLNQQVEQDAFLRFTLTDVLLPPFSGNSSRFVVSTFGYDGFKIDESSVDGLHIRPGDLHNASVRPSNFEVGGYSTLFVSFVLANPIPFNGKCRLVFDRSFSFAGVTVVSRSDPPWTIDTVAEEYLDLMFVTNQSNGADQILTSGQTISFEIQGLTNPIQLGSVIGFQIQTLLPTVAGVESKVIDQAIIEDFVLGPATFPHLEIELAHILTGSYGPLQLSAQVPQGVSLQNGTTIRVKTPPGFLPCSNDTTLGISSSMCEFSSRVNRPLVKCDEDFAAFESLQSSIIEIFFASDCIVPSEAKININISNVMNPVFDGQHSAFELTVFDHGCGEGNCMVHKPLPNIMLLTNEMLLASMQLEGFDADLSYTTGQPVKTVKVNVTTLNRLPDSTFLLVDVPRHFDIDDAAFAVTVSSTEGSRWKTPRCSCDVADKIPGSCCPHGQFFYFEVPVKMDAGSSLHFMVEGISNRLAKGDAHFQIRTAEINKTLDLPPAASSVTRMPNWLFLDRAIAAVKIQAANLAQLSLVIEEAIDFGVGADLRFTTDGMQTSTMRTGMVADLVVSFKTFNIMHHTSSVQIFFGEGFKLAGASVDLSKIPGHAMFSPPSDVLTIHWLNNTSLLPESHLSFKLKNITFPTNRQGELPHIGIRTISELGQIVHEDFDIWTRPMAIGLLRHVQATVVPSAAHPYVQSNSTVVLNVSFAFASTFFADSVLSIELDGNLFTLDGANVPTAVCMRRSGRGSNLRYIAKEEECTVDEEGDTFPATSTGPGAYLEVPSYNYSRGIPKGQIIRVLNATGGRQMESGDHFWVLIAGISVARTSTFDDPEQTAQITTYNETVYLMGNVTNVSRWLLDNASVPLKSYALSLKGIPTGLTAPDPTVTPSDPWNVEDSFILSLEPLIVTNLIAFPWVTDTACPSDVARVRFLWTGALSDLKLYLNGVESIEPSSSIETFGRYHSFTTGTCADKNQALEASVQIHGYGVSIAKALFLQVPSAPSNVNISMVNHGTIQLDWIGDPTDQVLYHELQVSADLSHTEEDWPGAASDWPLQAIVWGSASSHRDSVLYPCCAGGSSCCGLSTLTYENTSYIYSGRTMYARLRRINPVSNSPSWSNIVSITAIGKPTPPTLVSRAHASNGSSGVLLSWNPPPDVGLGAQVPGSGLASLNGFDLEMSEHGSTGPWTRLSSPAAQMLRHFEPLATGILYSFRVRGSNLLGPGEWSQIITFKGFKLPSPAPRPHVSVVSGNDPMMRVTFGEPLDTGYGDQAAPLTSVLVQRYQDSSFHPCCNDDSFSIDCASVSGTGSVTSPSLRLDSSFRLSSAASTATVSCSGCDCTPSAGTQAGSLTGKVGSIGVSGVQVCTWLISGDRDKSLHFSLFNLTSTGAENVSVHSCTEAYCIPASRTTLAELTRGNTPYGVDLATSSNHVYSTNASFLQVVFTFRAQAVQSDTIFFEATWSLAQPVLQRHIDSSSNVHYSFDIGGLDRGIAYRFRIKVANELAYSDDNVSGWSPLSDAVQAQHMPIPQPQFPTPDLPLEGAVVLGNLTYELAWHIPSGGLAPQDFSYHVRKYVNPEYKIEGILNVAPKGGLQSPVPHANLSFNSLTDDGFNSFQHVRTWGSVDLEFFAAGGQDFLAVINSQPLGVDSDRSDASGLSHGFDSASSEANDNWGYVGQDMEALMVYVYNSRNGTFGGECRYQHRTLGQLSKPACVGASTVFPCSSYLNMMDWEKQPHCSAFVDPPLKTYQYSAQFSSFIRGPDTTSGLHRLNVHQMISTYGASAIRSFSIDGDTFLMVTNTRIPNTFMCVEAVQGASGRKEYPYTDDAKATNDQPVDWKNVKRCLHWNDTTTCPADANSVPTRCMGHPAGSQAADASALYTSAHSVLYRYDSSTSEFYVHQVVPADQPRALAVLVSNNTDIGTNEPFVAIAQGAGPVQVYRMMSIGGCSGYFGAGMCLRDVATLQSSGASAVKILDVLNQPHWWSRGKNETLLIVAHERRVNTSDPINGMPQGSLYTWDSSYSSFVPHPTLFNALPTDGAVCLENANVDGRHIIVICQSSACSSGRPSDPVDVSTDNAAYVGPDGSCSVVYEWRNSSLTLVHILPVFGARSVTAFTRPSTRRGVEYDHYLLVAGSGTVGGEASSESVLLRWETVVSAMSLPLFQGYARVREIYTKEPRRWAVHASGSRQFAALAAAGHFEATSSNPFPQMPTCQATTCLTPGSEFLDGSGNPEPGVCFAFEPNAMCTRFTRTRSLLHRN